MWLAYHIQVGWFQFSLPPPAISHTPISICIGNRKSYFAQDWISSQILYLCTDFSANNFQTIHLQCFYLKAISCPAITHCLWCVRAMCGGAIHSRHFRLGSRPELRFINFIQISDTIKKPTIYRTVVPYIFKWNIFFLNIIWIYNAVLLLLFPDRLLCPKKSLSPLCVLGRWTTKLRGRCKYHVQVSCLWCKLCLHTFATICMQIPAVSYKDCDKPYYLFCPSVIWEVTDRLTLRKSK